MLWPCLQEGEVTAYGHTAVKSQPGSRLPAEVQGPVMVSREGHGPVAHLC